MSETGHLLQAPPAPSIRGNPLRASQQCVMFTKLSLRLLLATVMLAAALLRCVPGAPTNLPPAEGSGDEEEEVSYLPAACNITKTMELLIASTRRHKQEFKDEFSGNVEYNTLDSYKRPSFPVACPKSNSSKEACLQRLARGLLVYSALLRFVDSESPSSSIVTEVSSRIPHMIAQITQKITMKNVTLTTNQEQDLLKELDSSDLFHRKMTAYSILSSIYEFLVDSKTSLSKWEMVERQAVCAKGTKKNNHNGKKTD